MCRNRRGQFADPKRITLKDRVFTFAVLAVIVACAGQIIGWNSYIAKAEDTKSEVSSEYITPTVTPTITTTPSPSPTVTPTPTVTQENLQGGGEIGQEEVIAHIKSKGWPVEEALAVARCESNFNPSAIGDLNLPDGGPASYGVFQIRGFASRPDPSELLDYKKNIDFAYQIYEAQGWGPWTCKKVL